MKKFLLLFCAMSLALGIAANANAALIVDTGPPANQNGAYLVGVNSGGTSQWLAGQFTLAQGHDIYAMQGYLETNAAADQALVTIYSDNAGSPGTALISKTFMSQPLGIYGWQGTSGYAGHLDPGTYWIAFGEAQGSLFYGGMGTNNLGSPVMDAEAWAVDYAGWNLTGSSFGLGVYARIYDTAAVPLPGAFWLLSPGLVGLAAIRRRFKK